LYFFFETKDKRKSTKKTTDKALAKEKVQTIQWQKKKYKIKYSQSNDQRKSTK
jgi:hypothetical protein